MRRWMALILAAVWAASAGANDFFGIPILAEPKDDINAVIQNLIKGEYEKASLHLRHLAKTAPRLAKTIKLSDFTIPCADCLAEPDPECAACKGKLKAVDPYALRYLQYKFDNAIDEHEPVEKAWAASIAAFNIRKKQVPAREVFQGHILKIGQDAFLIKSVDDTVFYLMGCVTSGAQVGQPMLGYCWPMPDHPHSCKDEDGKSKIVKSFTLNLWWDY